MGWITIVKKKDIEHRCFPPGSMEILKKGAMLGSIWECDTCKNRHCYQGMLMGKAMWSKGRAK